MVLIYKVILIYFEACGGPLRKKTHTGQRVSMQNYFGLKALCVFDILNLYHNFGLP